ncbi:MBL fold metallo-hydrolase [Phycisphaerales bacterium AB-hyl4]|uniref:MBL fold metallo-hydrolase n=1 Tax=Natronomicrosphaera hydrolytica TaxID=3242702 RepID=A0ABV4U580_9BACT
MPHTDCHPLFAALSGAGSLDAATAPRTSPTPQRRAAVRRPQREAFRVCVLGSGSGGNCTVVRFADATLLIDLGFGPRTTARRLAQLGLSLDDIDAVCLTHLDQDHFRRSWPRHLIDRRIPVHLHHWHRHDLHLLPLGRDLEQAGLARAFDADPFQPIDRQPAITVRTARCQHDRQGTIAFRVDAPHASLGYATDLGHMPPSVVDHLAGVDLLAIESNYDEQMTIHSSRPTFVNRRNMSDSGHLSNEQAYDAVQRIAAASPHGNPRHVILLHRSSQCNHPMKVRRVFERSPALARRVVLTEQRRRTRWVPVRPLRCVQRTQWPLGFK